MTLLLGEYVEPGTVTVAGDSGGENDAKFLNYFLIILFGLAIVGLIYVAYNLFLKDCIILYKEKRRRAVTESGFGQSPARGAVTGTSTNHGV